MLSRTGKNRSAGVAVLVDAPTERGGLGSPAVTGATAETDGIAVALVNAHDGDSFTLYLRADRPPMIAGLRVDVREALPAEVEASARALQAFIADDDARAAQHRLRSFDGLSILLDGRFGAPPAVTAGLEWLVRDPPHADEAARATRQHVDAALALLTR